MMPITKGRKSYWLSISLLTLALAAPSQTQAVELLQLPTRVLIRGLAAFEQLLSLEVMQNGVPNRLSAKEGKADFSIANERLCDNNDLAYRPIRNDSQLDPTKDWLPLSRLCSAQKSGELTILFISDTQDDNDEHAKTAKLVNKMIDQDPNIRLVINGGDVIHKGVKEHWQIYRNIAQTYSSRVPLIPVLGNHDYSKDEDLVLWKAVYGTDETVLHYYLIDFDSAALIVLNSNTDKMEKAEVVAQTKWLEKTLKDLQSTKKPILVTYHHPAAASSLTNHTIAQSEIKYINKNWIPLLKKYNVSLVLNGHEHLYERLTVEGIQHLLAGPAGGNIGAYWLFGRYKYSQFSLKGARTVSKVKVGLNGTISIRTFDAAANDAAIDSFDFPVKAY